MVISGYEMKKITEDIEICKFDGISAAGVYIGSLTELKKVDVEWRKAEGIYGEDVEVLKLSEIVSQLPNALLITVITNGMFSGEIYQYGNYGDGAWWEIGCTCGYA